MLVLCYHAVSERWPAALAVTPRALEEQREHLVARGYRGATFHDALAAPPAPKTMAVTFDDAYRSVGELAFPILARLGLPATIFVPTDFPDGDRPMAWPGIDHWLGGPHEHELAALSWAELERLAGAGWEIGSHTCSHPRLTALDPAALARELERSRAACEARLGRPCRTVAYPYGDVDARVVTAAREAGYRFGAGLPEGRHVRHPLAWPRVGVYHAEPGWRWRLKMSPALRRLRGFAR